MIKEIIESDIPLILPDYNPELFIPDYTDNSGDGHKGYGFTGKFDIDIILRLAYSINAQSIFEFGTWLGRTTRILSLHIPKVYTLDVPKEDLIDPDKHRQSVELIPRDWIGYASKDIPSVTQFYGDSLFVMDGIKRQIDKVDMCFIDGDHSKEYVKSDTKHALDMTREGGIIIWHDVKEDGIVEVCSVINELDITVYHVHPTWIGFYVNR